MLVNDYTGDAEFVHLVRSRSLRTTGSLAFAARLTRNGMLIQNSVIGFTAGMPIQKLGFLSASPSAAPPQTSACGLSADKGPTAATAPPLITGAVAAVP